jgi:hypothetical protein
MSFKNKVFWQVFAMCSCAVYTLVSLNGCSADYDTFGKSDYRVLSEITLAEQESSPAVYPDNHRMEFDLVAPPESLETWDSVTVDAIDMSHFASLHLVKGKVEEFPTDSVKLDSLADKVSVSENVIKAGNKIAMPSEHVIYVVVVSESGKKSIWQLNFNIPEVKPKSSSSAPKSSNSAKSSSSAKSAASSNSSAASCSSTKSAVSSSCSTAVLASSSSAASSDSGKPGESSSSAKNESSSSAASVASSSSAAKSSHPPKILALSIVGRSAVVDEESKSIHVDDLDFRTDLTSLELSALELFKVLRPV